jgi:hypothetical protein
MSRPPIYVPECLKNLPRQKNRSADSKKKKAARDLASGAIIESITRVRCAKRSKPKDWERGYNSAITVLELFVSEILERRWAGIEGAVVNQEITTGKCTCGPGQGCTNCLTAKETD